MFDLEAAKKRCEAATKGPWEVENGDVVSIGNDGTRVVEGMQRHWSAMMSQLGRTKPIETCWEYAVKDIDFIAHSITDLPAAIKENESLRKRLAEIEGEIQEAVDDLDANEIPAARAHLSMITKGD